MPSIALKRPDLAEHVASGDDAAFDATYTPAIRALSLMHWTSIGIARRAAAFLAPVAGTRVLDIGCGPGKFCVVGALTTGGRFTGIERRAHLVDVARKSVARSGVDNAEILCGDVVDIEFARFDAFYIFNPFAENIGEAMAIDATVPLSPERHGDYIRHVAGQLAAKAIGTRVATYWGTCEEVPEGYRRVGGMADGALKFWEKGAS